MTARPVVATLRSAVVPWKDFALLAGVGIVTLHSLAVFWSANDDYFFGWGVPFLVVYLLAERWATRPAKEPQPIRKNRWSLFAILAAWGAAFTLIRLLVETEPGWRPGLWLVMSLYVGGVLAWFGLCGGQAWMRHFFFPVTFLFLAVPWLFNVEFPIVQGLMRWNAALVADSLVLADIPARAAGNTILLATGQLGVEEACSGIRSLQAVLMMSVFLGEFYRFSFGRRFLLPALAVLFALAGNYARLLFLAWRAAHAGTSSVEAAHDSAGLGTLVFTLCGLWFICLAMKRGGKNHAPAKTFPAIPESSGKDPATTWAVGLLLVAILGEGVTQAWYAYREHTAPFSPAWTMAWPRDAKNFETIPIAATTHVLLHDDESQTGSWSDAHDWRWQALWFRYRPTPANKIVFDSHNPEICLPGAGLREARDFGEFLQTVRGIPLRVHAWLFTSPTADHYVFWISYLNRGWPAERNSPHVLYSQSPAAFFARSLSWTRDAWQGRRGTDAQTLEVTVTGPPDFTAARAAYADFLDRAVVAGPR